MNQINIQQLQQAIADGYVQVQKHPTADLYIYNYTQNAQYEKVWNEITLACRGLIMDGANNIVARPFLKFFNMGEIADQVIPEGGFEVYEKMDGSLGILYWIDDTPYIATRGSFNSIQALEATSILHETYAASIPLLDKTKTYLFEIIYPANRIVVDYGAARNLYLLAVMDTATGVEEMVPLDKYADLGFPLAKSYNGINDLKKLQELEEKNKEGFVIRFYNGLRLKVKFAEYMRIHRIVTQVSNITIWEHLKDRLPIEHLLDSVADEFYDWVRMTVKTLNDSFALIDQHAKEEFKILDTRKACADYYFTCRHPAILFKMMEDRKYDYIIWKMIRPKFEKPFANKDE